MVRIMLIGNLIHWMILYNPPSVYGGKTKEEIQSILDDGWTIGSYGSEGRGWKFTKGSQSIFYHPGGGVHNGPYYGISSSESGKTKVVDPATYVATSSDRATIIFKE